MMKRWFSFFLLAIQLLFAVSANAAPQIPPKPTSSIYVQDYANVLSSQTINTINQVSQDLNAQTGAQIVVVTLKSLEGASLEDYSLELFRGWGIGNKEKNNGVLLLVAVDDRKSRIAVGYGLEGALPDGLTGRIQDRAMLPAFRNGDYDKGVMQGYASLANTVAKEYNVQIKGVKVTSSPQPNSATELPFWVKILIAVGILGLVLIDMMFFGGSITRLLLIIFMRGGGRGGGGGSFGGGSSGGGGSNRSW